jgi:hypothetical protein
MRQLIIEQLIQITGPIATELRSIITGGTLRTNAIKCEVSITLKNGQPTIITYTNDVEKRTKFDLCTSLVPCQKCGRLIQLISAATSVRTRRLNGTRLR